MAKDVDVLVRGLADGCTDLVFELIDAGAGPDKLDEGGISLLKWCAYYGDVSAMKFLISKGAQLASLGPNLDLNGACFHGHWRLCKFLLEQGADANAADSQNGETPLHSALCTTDRVQHDVVLRVLLSFGANPNAVTKPGVETGGFMRDARTKGETPLHRAAAFGNEATIELLLKYGAKVDIRMRMESRRSAGQVGTSVQIRSYDCSASETLESVLTGNPCERISWEARGIFLRRYSVCTSRFRCGFGHRLG